MREFIRTLADEGMSLFISSHLLSEIQVLCDRVAIISKGEVIAVGEVDALLKQSLSKVVWTVDHLDKTIELLEIPNASRYDITILSQTANTIETEMTRDDIPIVNQHLVQSG